MHSDTSLLEDLLFQG